MSFPNYSTRNYRKLTKKLFPRLTLLKRFRSKLVKIKIGIHFLKIDLIYGHINLDTYNRKIKKYFKHNPEVLLQTYYNILQTVRDIEVLLKPLREHRKEKIRLCRQKYQYKDSVASRTRSNDFTVKEFNYYDRHQDYGISFLNLAKPTMRLYRLC